MNLPKIKNDLKVDSAYNIFKNTMFVAHVSNKCRVLLVIISITRPVLDKTDE